MSHDPPANQKKPEVGAAASKVGSAAGLPAPAAGVRAGLPALGGRVGLPAPALGARAGLPAPVPSSPASTSFGEDGDDEQTEAATVVVPEDDSTALFRAIAELPDPSAATTVFPPPDDHTSILNEADLQLAGEHTSARHEASLQLGSEHTSILDESDLHSGSEPPGGALRPSDDHTSMLTEGDLELTSGTSVLADADLDFGAHAQDSRGKDYESYSMLDPRALLLGRAFGGFRIVREMASGGMASVFLARKDGPGRVSQHAAIKVVHPHLACQSGFVDMFLDEARIVSCVNHPNVCRVLDFGTAEGTYYLAMEYVLGETWAALQSALATDDVGKNALPAISAYVIAQAAEGLHAAHEATDDKGESLHIVHRDVSPQNIFVAYDGTVRVLDFGIARAADRITTTQAGTVKGRLAYMSPEQMEGRSIDRRADIWSLGVVLREALENRRLFRKGSDAETMLAVTTEPLPEWHGMSSSKLREIVDRALERELDQRYLTAHHLNVDLMRFCRSQASPVAMPEVSAWMHRLFKHKLDEKRLMLQEKAPEPRTGDTGPLQPWRSATSTQGFTPSGESAKARGKQPTGSYSNHGTMPEQPAPMVAPSTNRTLASVLLFAVVAGGAGAGVWFARNASRKQFAETTLAAGSAPVEARATTPTAAPAAPPSSPSVAPASTTEAAPTSAPVASPTPASPTTEPDTTAQNPTAPTPTASTEDSSTSAEADARALRRAERAAAREAREKEAKEKEAKAPAVASSPVAAPAPAAPAAQGAPGTVVVAYLGGWAEVYLGNKLLGTTPGRFTLPSGKQTLTIKPFGTGNPEQRTVDVPPGGTSKLAISPN